MKWFTIPSPSALRLLPQCLLMWPYSNLSDFLSIPFEVNTVEYGQTNEQNHNIDPLGYASPTHLSIDFLSYFCKCHNEAFSIPMLTTCALIFWYLGYHKHQKTSGIGLGSTVILDMSSCTTIDMFHAVAKKGRSFRKGQDSKVFSPYSGNFGRKLLLDILQF